jgi:phage-related protein
VPVEGIYVVSEDLDHDRWHERHGGVRCFLYLTPGKWSRVKREIDVGQ